MTRFVLKYRVSIVAFWLLAVIAGVLTMKYVPHRLDYSYTTPGQPGFISNEAISKRFGLDGTFESTLPMLQLPLGLNMHSAAGQDTAARVFEGAEKAGYFGIADYANTHDPTFILDGGTSTWALITIPNPDTGDGVGGRIPKALQAATPPEANLEVTGFEKMLSNDGSNGSNRLRTTMIGAAAAFVVMLFVYGSFVSILPVLMALMAIPAIFFAVFGMTFVAPISYFIAYMITTLTLGMAVDFSLVVVIRWREEREAGLSNEDAILIAGKTAGRAVMLSGVTAGVGLLSLVVLPVPFLRSIGIGTMIIPLVSVALATTLLPIALLWWGPALDRFCFWPRGSTTHSRSWTWWGKFVYKNRWAAAAVAVVLLAILSMPGLWLNTAEPLISSLSPSEKPAARAFAHLKANGIPNGVDFPVQIIIHGGAAGLTEARRIIRSTPGVYGVYTPNTYQYRRGSDSLVTVVTVPEGGTSEGKAMVLTLRQGLQKMSVGSAEVGGSSAADMAFTDAVYGNFPLLLTVTSLITLLILTRALRSIVLAIKAIVTNLISLGATYGFMVFFWQWGHGSQLFYGLPATGSIRDWIPTFVFACIFGLSMDYEVFVLARMREEYDRTGSNEDAVVIGLARTGRLVTCAALVFTVCLLAIALDPNQLVKITSTTLAAGILIDAVIVRSLLVPAVVALMGNWNWWVPPALRRMVGVSAVKAN